MDDSILDTIKKLVNVDPEVTDFDMEIITHINSTFFTLHQMGVGPRLGFMILDRTSKWSEFIGEEMILAVKTYLGLKVRLLFDPPATGPTIAAMERQAEQMEWRLNYHREEVRAETNARLSDDVTIWTITNGVFPPESREGDIGIDPVTGDIWRDV